MNNSLAFSQSKTALRDTFKATVSEWRASGKIDPARAFEEHPELLDNRSVALDLVFEAYCLLCDANREEEAEQICCKFPALEGSIRKQIEVFQLLQEKPHLLKNLEVPWPQEGDSFDDFELVEEIGRGSFSRVYLAQQKSLDRIVVLKVGIGESRESNILAQLLHQQIVPILSVHKLEHTPFHAICMPYISRQTLESLQLANDGSRRLTTSMIRDVDFKANAPIYLRKPLDSTPGQDVNLAIELGKNLADALQAAHSKGICHLDVKPSNILFAPEVGAMLLDFNLAAHDTSAKPEGGTLPYMSPEQLDFFLGNSQECPSSSSDVYSLGVVLFELVVGKRPFAFAKNASFEIAGSEIREQQSEIKRVSGELRLACGCDSRFVRLIIRCLDPKPWKRPKAGEIHSELSQYQRPHNRLKFQLEQRLPKLACSVLTVAILTGIVLNGVFQLFRDTVAGNAALLVANGKNDDAYRAYRSLPEDGFSAKDWMLKGLSESRTGRRLDAERSFIHAYEKDNTETTRLFKAYGLANNFKHSEAIKTYGTISTTRDSDLVTIHNNAAFSHVQFGNPGSGLDEAELALQYDPNCPAALLNRALALVKLAVRLSKLPDRQREYGFLALEAAEDLAKRRPDAAMPKQVAIIAARVCANFDPSCEEVAQRMYKELLAIGATPLNAKTLSVTIPKELEQKNIVRLQEPELDQVLQLP